MTKSTSATDSAPSAIAAPGIRAVVFDMDGLLFDTEALFFRVAGEAMAVRGKEFTLEMMRAMIGRRSVDAYPALERLAGLDEPVETLMAEIRRRFFDVVDTAVHPTPGLIALLDVLRKAGLPAAVATSSRREYAERLLRRHRLWDRFQFLLTSENVTRGKPDPEIYQTAAARFGVPPRSVLVLEDSPAGLAAAKAAGTFAVGVPHDHSPAEDMVDANLIVPRLDDAALLRLIDASGEFADETSRGSPGPF
jgi:HAD superfamily hydrolase (TIGR01509 family)